VGVQVDLAGGHQYPPRSISLTLILEKNTFGWSDEAKYPFTTIKDAMCTTLVLAMLDVNMNFVLECDGSSRNLGVVVM